MTHAAPSNDSWASACRGFRCLSGYRGPLTTRYRDIRALLIWAENAGRAAALAVAFLVSVHQDDIKGFRPHFDPKAAMVVWGPEDRQAFQAWVLSFGEARPEGGRVAT